MNSFQRVANVIWMLQSDESNKILVKTIRLALMVTCEACWPSSY